MYQDGKLAGDYIPRKPLTPEQQKTADCDQRHTMFLLSLIGVFLGSFLLYTAWRNGTFNTNIVPHSFAETMMIGLYGFGYIGSWLNVIQTIRNFARR